MHKIEEFMQAALAVLVAAMDTATVNVVRDSPYGASSEVTEYVVLSQGESIVLNQNMAFIDSLVTFYIDMFAAQQDAATPIGTLLNARASEIIQAFAPTTQGDNTFGVVGASQLLEGDMFPPVPDRKDVPVADMRMVWTVQIRRQVDNPEVFP